MRCEECQSENNVTTRPAMTAYHWDGTGKDPNAPVTLCEICMNDYVSRWTAMWDEYYASQGCY